MLPNQPNTHARHRSAGSTMEIVSDFNPTGPAKTVIDQNNPLKLLVNRLEAATSRLEDIAASTHGLDESSPANAPSSAKAVSTPVAPALSEPASVPTARAVVAPPPPFLADLDVLLETDLKTFVAASAAVDSLLAEQAAAVADCFSEHRKILLIATKAKKPDMGSPAFVDLIKNLVKSSGVVIEIKDKNFGTPFKFHVQMVEGGVWSLNWPFMPDKPADHVNQSVESAEMFGNKVTTADKAP
jgi:adenylyl cyclase-associated protein